MRLKPELSDTTEYYKYMGAVDAELAHETGTHREELRKKGSNYKPRNVAAKKNFLAMVMNQFVYLFIS